MLRNKLKKSILTIVGCVISFPLLAAHQCPNIDEINVTLGSQTQVNIPKGWHITEAPSAYFKPDSTNVRFKAVLSRDVSVYTDKTIVKLGICSYTIGTKQIVNLEIQPDTDSDVLISNLNPYFWSQGVNGTKNPNTYFAICTGLKAVGRDGSGNIIYYDILPSQCSW